MFCRFVANKTGFLVPTLCKLRFSRMASGKCEAAAVVSGDEIKRFIVDCMVAVGTSRAHAGDLADVLVAGDSRGHYSHGLNRLELYVNDIKHKVCIGQGNPSILKETVSTALVDGNNLLGPVVGNFCIDLAARKAKETGIGMVVARGSNHFGIAGWYSMRAMEQGLIGMSFTNSSPLVATTRGKKPVMGTNPLSFAAAGNGDDSFVLDMATCCVALGKVEMQDRKNLPIPSGWGIDSKGQVTNDPKDVLNGGSLLPLGGAEETGGYKGYGLAVMDEILCGILAGSLYGSNVRSWKDNDSVANLGQCFIAINPDMFAPGFGDRLSDLLSVCRNQEPAEGQGPVLVAGDPEKIHIGKCNQQGGIEYHINQIHHAAEIAKSLGVAPLKVLK